MARRETRNDSPGTAELNVQIEAAEREWAGLSRTAEAAEASAVAAAAGGGTAYVAAEADAKRAKDEAQAASVRLRRLRAAHAHALSREREMRIAALTEKRRDARAAQLQASTDLERYRATAYKEYRRILASLVDAHAAAHRQLQQVDDELSRLNRSR